MGFWKSPASAAILFAALLTGLMGCAGTAPAGDGKGAGGGSANLESIRPELHASEDSLILDLLIGYQSLLANTQNTETMRRARDARNQLEYMLRYGGVVSHGREGRVFTLPNGTKLTLQEMAEQMSKALLFVEDTNWNPETDRAHEILKHKPELAELAEDANWVITLSNALDGTLPANVKKQLRSIHENYSKGGSHQDIARQVNTLIPKVNDEHLKKELKKLANRSWDRDKRAGKMDSTSVRADNHPPQQMDTTKSTPPQKATPIKSAASLPAQQDSLKETSDRIDSLSSKGNYLEALRVLETVEDQAGANWVLERRQSLGNRYCEDRRNVAAASFITARKSNVDSTRVRYLRQSLSQLDSCLFQFPDAKIADKVRRNRALVEKELRH